MANYAVHVFCNECSYVHPMGILISLNDGPTEKKSIGDTYRGKPLPANVATLHNNQIICPNTGKPYIQKNNDQIFLVPIG